MTMRVVGDSEGKFYMGSKVVIYCSSDNTISDQMVNIDNVYKTAEIQIHTLQSLVIRLILEN